MTKLVILYLSRSPSQIQDDSESFTENLEINVENLVQRNSFLVVAIRDFNAKSSSWFRQEKQALKDMQLNI